MVKSLSHFYATRLMQAKSALEKNNFEVHIVQDAAAANSLVTQSLIPRLKIEEKARSISFGGSMTIQYSGIYDAVKAIQDIEVLDTYDRTLPPFEALSLRRQSLLADIFISSSNAITENGRLVNLDGIGNRVAALAFGPRFVIVVCGRNKITKNLETAMDRVKNHAAPINSLRLQRKTPCTKTMHCENCKSPDRICSTWAITEKSWPKNRIKVVLVDEDLGY